MEFLVFVCFWLTPQVFGSLAVVVECDYRRMLLCGFIAVPTYYLQVLEELMNCAVNQ